MSPQTPKDPGDLSLRPSASVGSSKKAGFSNADFANVQGQADTVPASGPTGSGKAADFSSVQGSADTVPRIPPPAATPCRAAGTPSSMPIATSSTTPS